ncbi:2-haloacrylate reductase [Aquicella siphonis]|uniref:2-haloacrylate reductase n=1 Tax=Aquicella siphonis TaxID=254247 RepID=A0A5E4PEV3_9COXI|nr:zinc-dependent alcohol dehydrogenase family protein [Aquicella siphonis]VVC75519.1 2-haloacrylate reductase [Aquicella siphonis]
MRAQVIRHFGDTSVFTMAELARPEIRPGHVLVRVHATSVNPVDFKIRSGLLPQIAPEFPAVLHGDFAGVIEEVGAGVTEFKVGDAVFGCAGGVKGEGGALAEFMLVDADLIAKKPVSLNMAEAAALPLVTLTAWEALFEKIRLKPGQTILIHAGTGGVGHVAIQLAAWAGAKVCTTVSSDEKAAVARSLGASEVINYRNESVQDYVERLTGGKGFEVVLDTVGGENIDKSMAAVALYGSIVSIQTLSTHDLGGLLLKSASLHVVFMLLPMLHHHERKRHGAILRQAADLADLGRLKPLIDPRRFSLEEVSKSHALLESGHALGKVVIQLS